MARTHARARAAFAIFTAVLAAGCSRDPQASAARSTGGGDVERGQRVLRDYGCHSCHAIPGVPGAHAMAGPPLEAWATRTYIAGRLHNTPENLVKWIQDPKGVDPKTTMPDMNVTATDARDMAAYLLSLR